MIARRESPRSRSKQVSALASGRVWRALEAVNRRDFVPDEVADQVGEDHALPIGRGQTISQPSLVAAMTDAIQPRPTDRVLEIGAGSGFHAAVLARLVHKVYSIEIDPQAAEEASKRLQRLGYKNVEVRVGDGYEGLIEEAPFDAIVVTAAAKDVPPPLMNQLKVGGRMIIPIGTPFGPQELTLIEKHERSVTTRPLMPVRFVSFRRHLV